jgi:sporulation protein YunB
MKRKQNRAFKVVCIILIVLISFVLIDMKIRPVVQTVAINRVRQVATQTIMDAISEQLAARGTSYNSIVSLAKDGNGKITSVETDSAQINMINSKISSVITSRLETLSKEKLKIPLGTLLGAQFLSGRGPNVTLKAIPSGFVKTQVVSEFNSVGINQTRHRIFLNIDADITAIIPGYSSSAETTVTYVVAESIIIGEVPQYYTNVITDSENLAGDINDYGNPIP